MNIHSTPAFKDCYIMQPDDLQRFAATLADGFKGYSMYQHFAFQLTGQTESQMGGLKLFAMRRPANPAV